MECGKNYFEMIPEIKEVKIFSDIEEGEKKKDGKVIKNENEYQPPIKNKIEWIAAITKCKYSAK
jgi:hypothetical protein